MDNQNTSCKYNYVFMNVSEDYLAPCFFPLKKYPNVRVYRHAFQANKLTDRLFRLHWSKKINSKIQLPFKSLWFSRMCRQDFDNSDPICYVFLGGKYICEDERLLRYIKKQNSRNKCIISCFDLIAKKHWDMEKVKKCCDYVMTYDAGEAEKYGILFFDDLAYGEIMDVTTPDTFENDVYFLGFAKDRLADIHKVHTKLSRAGLKCKFIVCGTKPEDRMEGEGLVYQEPISYRENLRNVLCSKCILELLQGGSEAPTLRMKEAQVYKRKLLSNNAKLPEQAYFDRENMRVFEDAGQIDLDFIRSPMDYGSFDAGHYDPAKRIAFLEALLGKEQENG